MQMKMMVGETYVYDHRDCLLSTIVCDIEAEISEAFCCLFLTTLLAK